MRTVSKGVCENTFGAVWSAQLHEEKNFSGCAARVTARGKLCSYAFFIAVGCPHLARSKKSFGQASQGFSRSEMRCAPTKARFFCGGCPARNGGRCGTPSRLPPHKDSVLMYPAKGRGALLRKSLNLSLWNPSLLLSSTFKVALPKALRRWGVVFR